MSSTTDHSVASASENWAYCYVEQVGFVLELPGTCRGAVVLHKPTAGA